MRPPTLRFRDGPHVNLRPRSPSERTSDLCTSLRSFGRAYDSGGTRKVFRVQSRPCRPRFYSRTFNHGFALRYDVLDPSGLRPGDPAHNAGGRRFPVTSPPFGLGRHAIGLTCLRSPDGCTQIRQSYPKAQRAGKVIAKAKGLVEASRASRGLKVRDSLVPNIALIDL